MKTKITQYTGSTIKNGKHAMQLLIDGFVLRYAHQYYKLDPLFDSIKLLTSYVDNINWRCTVDTDLSKLCGICDKEIFQETEIKWFTNIPKEGILCKVSDVDENALSIRDLAIIVHYHDDQTFPFIALTKAGNLISHKIAVPVSRNELKQYFYEN